MSYDPTGPYRPQDPSNEPWRQPPPAAEPTYGVPSPGPSYPPPPGYPTSGGGYPPPQPAYPPPGYQQPGYPPPPVPPQRNTALIVTLIVVIVLVVCGGGIAVFAVALSHSKPTANRTPLPGPVVTDTGGRGNLSTNGTIPFGDSHSAQWTDKVTASVVSVVKFTPSSTAAGTHEGQTGIKVTVKINNNSDKRLDLTLASVKVKSGANGTQADTIVDLESNLGLGFDGAVPPGNAATATYGFSVPTGDLSKIDVEVSPDFDHDSAIFEGAAS